MRGTMRRRSSGWTRRRHASGGDAGAGRRYKGDSLSLTYRAPRRHRRSRPLAGRLPRPADTTTLTPEAATEPEPAPAAESAPTRPRDPSVYRARLRELRAQLNDVTGAIHKAYLAAERRAERIELKYRLQTAEAVGRDLQFVEIEFGGTRDMIPLRTPKVPWSRIDRAIDLLERAIPALATLPHGSGVGDHIGVGSAYGDVFTDFGRPAGPGEV